MIILTVDEIITIHEKLTAATGGSPGLRDRSLLESAVLGCYQSFGDTDLYPTIEEKAARMAYVLCRNHSFVDGNKRIAVTSMLVLLRLNGIVLNYTQQELVSLGLGIADGSLDYEYIFGWVNTHIT